MRGVYLVAAELSRLGFIASNHIYVLVNLRHNKAREMIEYFIVPSRVFAGKMLYSKKI